jgi:uncharacterized 2Fe-2S/4Fe-4S cluster protein (DUF4445 family)
VNPPTENECIQISEKDRAAGIRLACQVYPGGDLNIELLNPGKVSAWSVMPEYTGMNKHPVAPLPGCSRPGYQDERDAIPYGLAIDIGTTSLSLSILDLQTGQRLSTRRGRNPQYWLGADVLTRLTRASASDIHARDMQQRLVEGIGSALKDMAERDRIALHHIRRAVLVGNTVMLSLLSGRNHDKLLNPEYWMRYLDVMPASTDAWKTAWHLHRDARIECIPPVAGFVGSDLVAGIIATGLMQSRQRALFVDFGTNSEMALWDGNAFFVTSAAGGPAFEGCGMSRGMPAEPGAVYRANMDNRTYSVIGGGRPAGICGSGMVDIMAGLLEDGILTEKGSFAGPLENSVYCLDADTDLQITKRDVDIFQRAKAAIGVGLYTLLKAAGPCDNGPVRIYVGGAFGVYLDVRHAQQIGLLPSVSQGRVILCGNTALAGCECLLMTADIQPAMATLRRRMTLINLARSDQFEEYFLEHLYLKPFTVECCNPK